MGTLLTASQRHWVEIAAKHADDFAGRAAQHDRDNSFPFENFDAMRASGYTNMPIPAELGGGGASLLDICMAQERLARGDGATALAVNMHLGFLWILGDLWRSSGEAGHEFLEKVAQDRSILFGAVSDPAADSLRCATGFGYTTVRAERVEGGYCINGRKIFGTNSPVGDLFGSTAVYHDPVEGDLTLLFIIPKDTPGLVCQNDWDTLGMRASSSHSWVFQNVFVEDAAVTRRKAWEWDEYVRGIWAWHGGTFASIYLGIARAARDFAVEYTKTRTRLPFHKPESHYPSSQFLAAQMDIGLKAAWAFQTDIAARLADPQTRDEQAFVDALAMQHFCMHTAVDVVNKAIDMMGGSALARRLPMERYYRDVRSGPMHPISGYDALEVIGKHAFGIPRDSDPRWV
jgi:alkylation response protein AidB-like acyl-CoA dehydrogenase